ncbi:SH3 domain-containing protein [Burkholderia gladioli]|uniref:SH3 domain-containing protein n=1 Tax=Burkholderia gladioli TaxID=28095 RepID=UPI001641E5E8|nr:SH3 domain-containing protein [Burkholderia gladioli]
MSQHHSSGPHTPPAKPATSSSTLSAPAPEPYKPLAWAFPFTPADKSDGSDPMTYMKALAAAEDGFYPLGANGMWHGGIHFDQNTAKHLKQDEGIRAIADGEVVAYRLDSKYPEQDYQDGRHALYSTGFVLVRHKLQLPPPPPPKPDASKQVAGQPATAPASAAPATAGKASTASTPAAAPASSQPRPGETLTFFSLYMHLMDWNTYQSASAQAKVAQVDAAKLNMAPMPYWEGERFYRVGDKANDSQDVPKPKAPAAPPRDLIGEFIQSDFKTVPEPDAPDDDTANLPPPIKGIRIRESPNGKIIGILPKGSELTVSDTDEVAKAKPGWAKIKTIKSGTPAAAVVGGTPSPHAPYGYVYAKELDAVVNPQPLDSVVVLKQPYPVKAGDVVGQLGHYLRYTEAKLLPAKPTRPLLHLEVFAGPELEAFIQKSRARAKELPAAKTFLEISPGARLVTELAEPDQKLQPGVKLVPLDANAKGKWVKVQPKTAAPVHGGRHAKPTYTNSGAPVWVDGSLANTTTSAIVPGWKDFPLSFSNAKGPGADFRDVFRRVDLDKAGADSTVKDDKGRAWFLVTIGAKDGSARQGWACEQDHPLVRMCGPWDWPGFELIDNSSIMPVDMLKRYIHVTEQYLADESKTEFEASAATVNAGPLITNLEKAIDTDHDGKVTALELKHAQETPWMAEALSHLVVRCESEWGGGLGKWEALSPLMKKLLWLWKTEIERIGKLQWWEQVASVEGFPKEPSPWHFHPIGIAGNFIKSGGGPLDELIKKLGDVISHGEGGYDAYNTGTHGQSGPVVHAYTDPPAGTITRQKIKDILASGSKSPDATDRYFTSGKYQTTVYTLAEAVKKMGLTGEEIYDADMQERVFREFLIYHAGGGKLAAFIFKNVGSLTDAQYAASQEWASIAAPDGTKIKDGRISDGTLSYYEKAKQNHANPRSTAMVIAVLEEIDRSR